MISVHRFLGYDVLALTQYYNRLTFAKFNQLQYFYDFRKNHLASLPKTLDKTRFQVRPAHHNLKSQQLKPLTQLNRSCTLVQHIIT
jgi:hypothetical protein